MNSFTMVEFPSTSAHASAEFFGSVFGWTATPYGSEYTDVDCGGGVGLGFQQDRSEAPTGPLAVIRVNDLETTRGAVLEAGGTITVEAFDFPGGRRFHFREPGGNELAAWVPIER
ncbi:MULTISPECIES: VOC family protein [Streptomyces]|uniref:VOC family protein n=1 Tax=Streptomyces TaxID=1883 RepID=UPI00163D3063|nr:MULTISPECIES: VOC family protein [Streptomyces]MBC2874606.1 VOC family protein [Streptomyces sp. TYQ1024]UBI36629.1 VOC family protein [Streptomyces mobaraensis]UKW29221.1 VOC family protein [Streptomyces sp. TYQ1024]